MSAVVAPAAADPDTSWRAAAGRSSRAWLPPLIAGVVILLLWEGVLRLLDPQGFVLPLPSEIIRALIDDWSVIWTAARNTGFIAVTGLIAGTFSGAVLAVLVSRFRTANETLTPLAVAVNAIPIVALAPIFNAWFGILSPRSNQAVVIVLVFFPVFINTTRGLSQVEPSQIELMRSYAAGDWRIMREVRVPHALPYLFTALKIASSLAVIGAIVAEYFGGRQDALGPIITQNAGLTRYAEAWAAVVAGSAIGIGLYIVVSIAERLALPWHLAARAGGQ